MHLYGPHYYGGNGIVGAQVNHNHFCLTSVFLSYCCTVEFHTIFLRKIVDCHAVIFHLLFC